MQSHYILVIVATLFGINRADKYLSEKPPHLNPCKIKDPDFNKCIAKNLQSLFVEWKDGAPGLSNLGKFDPFSVKRIKIVHDNSGPVAISMDLQNVLISGASKAIVQSADLDTKHWKNTIKVFAPTIDFDSDYTVKGHVLTLPLNGNGKAKFSAENVVLIVRFTMKLRDDDDFTFTELQTFECSIESVKNFHLQVDNLFNGQKEVEEAANALFNENWRDLFESLRPAIEQSLGKVLENHMKKLFHYVPANYFIENMPKANDS